MDLPIPSSIRTVPDSTTTSNEQETPVTDEKKLLPIGSDAGYSYIDLIKRPDEMKISNKGTMKQLGKNIAGIINYLNLLVTGDSVASKQGGQPLGDAYFINTNSQCVDKEGNTKPRHFYINNIPGKTSIMGRGLVGGIVHDIAELDPTDLLSSMTDTEKPPCSLRTFKVVDKNGKMYKETRYVVDSEVKDYKDLTSRSKYRCRADIQKKNGNNCCIFDENEKSLYPDADDAIICQEPIDNTQSGFRNRRNNPYTYHKRKKLDKHFKMLILFVILMIIIFI